MSYSGRPPRLSPQLRNEPSYWKAIEELKLNKCKFFNIEHSAA